MSEKMIGERIAYYRKKAGMSQEKVAEYMEVSRQAVTKWEGDRSKPSSDNLIKLASLFDIDVEVLLGNKDDNSPTTGDSVTISKAPWIFIGISFVVLLLYIIVGSVMKNISPGTVITGFVVLIPIQLFLHLYFTYSIKNESFNGLAGYDSKISYDLNVLKKILTHIDLNIGMSSTVFIFLSCAVDYLHLGSIVFIVVFVAYIVDLVASVLVNNYRMIDKLYRNDEDKERARKGMPVFVVYLILLLAGLLVTIIVFEEKKIDNNTAPAMKVITLTILGMLFATGGYAFENRNITKWKPGESIYKISKISILGALFSLALFGLILLV
jgi:transcriptional regulator with XRE-family HTH domain